MPGQQRPGDRQIRDALYCWAFRDRDNPPGEIAKFPNPYMGIAKLDFAEDVPGIMDAFSNLSK